MQESINLFQIIAAMDPNRGIGIKNKLPWEIKADMAHFKEETIGGTVIMGRKTWESIPEKYRPLPERLNIVVTRQEDYKLDPTPLENPPETMLAHSLEDALQIAYAQQFHPIFVIGGGNIYEQAITREDCGGLVLTLVGESFDCDAFFPELPANFVQQDASPFREENGLEYAFLRYGVIG
jgi:dihydrofolate reductase